MANPNFKKMAAKMAGVKPSKGEPDADDAVSSFVKKTAASETPFGKPVNKNKAVAARMLAARRKAK